MLIRCIHTLIRRTCSRCGMDFWMCHRMLFAVLFTLMFIVVSTIIRRTFWQFFLLPHYPQQTRINPREQALIIKHLQKFNQTTSGREASMLEYGAGDSTFVYSVYVRRYVRIEHNTNDCRIFERMAAIQSNTSIIISYMKSSSNSYVETRRFERNAASSSIGPSIRIYCVAPLLSMLVRRFFAFDEQSTYRMYQNYIDFVSIYLPNQLFDFVLLDGPARPQVAYTVLKHLNGESAKIFVHDWNYRIEYHLIAREFYKIIDYQLESNQTGSGGLVVLRRMPGVTGVEKIDQVQWKFYETPRWWF